MNSNFNNKPPSFAPGSFYLFRTLKTSQVQSKLSIALKIILSSLLLVCFSPVHAALTDGLVAYYCFDDATNIGKDCSTNDNNGSPIGQVNSVAGWKGNAASFGGYSSPASIHIPNSTSLQFSQDFSVAFAVKMTGFNGMDGYGRNASFGAHAAIAKSHDRRGMALLTYGDSKTGNVGTGIASFGWNNAIGGIAPNSGTDKWVHFIYIFSNTQHKTQLFANGTLVATKDGFSQGLSAMNSQDLYLGKYSDSWYPLNGALDDVRIYNRALTDAEVTALYQQGTSPAPNDTLGNFIDLNQSKINYTDNTVTLKFTKPAAELSNYFDTITPWLDLSHRNWLPEEYRNRFQQYSVTYIKKILQSDNSVTLPLQTRKGVGYNLKDYPNNLIQVWFQKTGSPSAAHLVGIADQLRYFAPNSITNSRTVAETKPTNDIVCNNKQGIQSPCNNFIDTTEISTTEGVDRSQEKRSVFRETLSHRLVDFDGIVPVAQINNTWANTAYGTAPKGDDGRIPLLLIHGWQGDNDLRNPAKLGLWENSELHYWQHFLDYYLATPALQAKYHIYLYHYPSYKHVTYNAKILNDMLYELGDKKPDSDLNIAMQQSGKGVVILAHSMGGLVARSAIEEYEAFGATGEKLRRLITLDTPHHGSPVSQPATWELEEFKPKLAQTLFKDPYTQGSSDLNWDNFDGHFNSTEVNNNNQQRWDTSAINDQAFDKAYWDVCATNIHCSLWGTQNPWLSWMNSNFEAANNPYNNKYLLYAGWMIQAGGKDVNIVDNGLLKLSNSVLTEVAKIPSGGAEPVSSALWYSLGNYDNESARPFTLLGYDNESPFYSNCDNTGKTPWVSEQWEGGNLSYQKINVISSGETICGNSVLITKSPSLSTPSSLHPLAFQFRVFWDYSHENMINGAYPDGKKGGWDQYIIQPLSLSKSASANSAFPGTNKESVMRVKRNYVARATSYRNGSAFTQPNVNLYNPLKLEPLFNVLEKDLARTNDEEFIVQ